MEHISKKTRLGVALQGAINELKLEREKTKILKIFHQAFMEKYEQFKARQNNSVVTLKGRYIADNEFPIGDNDKEQYFRTITYQARVNNQLINSMDESRQFTLVEGYSRDEDSKNRGNSKMSEKHKSNASQSNSHDKGKKKRKLN